MVGVTVVGVTVVGVTVVGGNGRVTGREVIQLEHMIGDIILQSRTSCEERRDLDFISVVPEIWANAAATASTAPRSSTRASAASRKYVRASAGTWAKNLPNKNFQEFSNESQ